MPRSRTVPREAIRAALRPDREVELGRRLRGALDLLTLRAELEHRIQSGGGRPTDPSWDTQRLIHFRSEVWNDLVQIAEELRAEGASASAGHIASLLIEKGVETIKSSPARRARRR